MMFLRNRSTRLQVPLLQLETRTEEDKSSSETKFIVPARRTKKLISTQTQQKLFWGTMLKSSNE